jgi:hypothetical protein
MPELSAQQMAVLEGLRQAGFSFVAFPLYASQVGVRKGNCAALLAPVEGRGMQVFGEPSYLVGGNLSVRIARDGREWFVWKKARLEATPERRAELERFSGELRTALAGLEARRA